MRASVSLFTLVVAALVATGPAMAKKPSSSPAVVVISVDDEGGCTVWPKSVTIVARDAPAGTKGPKKVRFFYARGDGDSSKVKLRADPNQKHPGILDLPQIGESHAMGDSSESQETFTGSEYVFTYVVEIEADGETVVCDPDIVIKKPGG